MKKFLKIASVIVAVIVLGLAITLVSALEEHPEGAPPTDHVVANPAFQAQANAASTRLGEIYRESMPPSLSVAVAVNGELAWAEAIGYAFLDDAIPATLDSKYRIGSVSKSLTAAAAGVLMDANKLDIEANFYSLVPSFPAKKHAFTIRQLGGHLAGVRHYRPGLSGIFETYNQTQYDTVLDSLEFVVDDPLAFEPGTNFQYSSFGYNMFSAALEAAAGEPFLTLMQRSIFEPLAMTNTTPDYQDRPVENVVGFYMQADDLLIRSLGVNNSYKWAGGGFLSTPSDLVKFGSALLNDSLISRATRDLLWTPQRLANGEMNAQFYGVGYRIRRCEQDGRLTVSHGGSSAGGITSFVIYPEANVVVAVTSNIAILSSTLRIGRVATEMAGFFLAALPE